MLARLMRSLQTGNRRPAATCWIKLEVGIDQVEADDKRDHAERQPRDPPCSPLYGLRDEPDHLDQKDYPKCDFKPSWMGIHLSSCVGVSVEVIETDGRYGRDEEKPSRQGPICDGPRRV